MKRFGVSFTTIPVTGRTNEQILWVNLHVHEEGKKPRLVSLVDYHHFAVPDAAQGRGIEWAVEVADIIYQVLTERLGGPRRRASESEVNARPSDTSTN